MGNSTARVKEILSWYAGNPPGVLANLARMLNYGRLAGTGKMVILPVDQGFEHGPMRSFGKVPAGNDPRYHFELAIEAGCSAHAAPLGALETGAVQYAGDIPLILKLNNSDSLSVGEPCSAITGSVKDALLLGCSAIGFTIYPGSSLRNTMYEEIRELIAEAKSVGLPTVLWSYPRGSGLSKAGETALDVIAYGAHIACQLGAHVIKVKAPSAHLEQAEAKQAYEAQKLDIKALSARVRHVVTSCFAGRRIVIFSGGATKGDQEVMAEINEIAAGGAHGSIMGRNIFQRNRPEALALLRQVMDAFA
jgi:class I fructose-bisphosphate aldolase